MTSQQDRINQLRELCRQDNIPKLEQELKKASKSQKQKILNTTTDDRGPNGEKTTILDEACEKWSTECVRVLVQYGADVNLQNGQQDTPLHCTCRSGTRDVTQKVWPHQIMVSILVEDHPCMSRQLVWYMYVQTATFTRKSHYGCYSICICNTCTSTRKRHPSVVGI